MISFANCFSSLCIYIGSLKAQLNPKAMLENLKIPQMTIKKLVLVQLVCQLHYYLHID